MKTLYISLLLLFCMVTASAQSPKEEADKAYKAEKYAVAAQKYEALLQSNGESFDVRYNLGNSYFKMKEYGKSILNYERALLLDPNNADARFNLEFVNGKTTDKIVPKSEIFIVTWMRYITQLFNESEWAIVGISAFILFLIGIGCYLYVPLMWIRKVGFFGALLAVFVCVVANVCSSVQSRHITQRNHAIVMSKAATVKSTPDERGTDLFVLHEGTKVRLTDDSMKNWKEVELADGKKGWIPTNDIEKI